MSTDAPPAFLADTTTAPEHRPMGFLTDISNLQQRAEGRKAQYLLANGRPGSATIEAIRDTGLTSGDDPAVELDLAVSLAGADAYTVTHRQTISRIAIPSFQPGATVRVRVDPVDPQSLMIG